MLKSLLKPSLLSCVRGINVLLANSVMTSMAERPRTGVNSLEDWSNKWREGVTGWHLKEVNPLLIKHFDLLTDGRQNVSAFVPLCGKSVDLKWIHERGHRVIGLEFDAKVVEELFAESGIAVAEVTKCGELQMFSNRDQSFRVYQGDFFAFRPEFESGPFDAIWDRAALVAINLSDRCCYVSIMKSVMAPSCRYLLATVDYDTSEYTGPPHAFSEEALQNLFTPSTSLSNTRVNFEQSTSDSNGPTILQLSFVEKMDALVERRKQMGLTHFDETVHVVRWMSCVPV